MGRFRFHKGFADRRFTRQFDGTDLGDRRFRRVGDTAAALIRTEGLGVNVVAEYGQDAVHAFTFALLQLMAILGCLLRLTVIIVGVVLFVIAAILCVHFLYREAECGSGGGGGGGAGAGAGHRLRLLMFAGLIRIGITARVHDLGARWFRSITTFNSVISIGDRTQWCR